MITDDGESFKVWIACNDVSAPRYGTYIELNPDGSMVRCTIRPDGEEEFEVMGARDKKEP